MPLLASNTVHKMKTHYKEMLHFPFPHFPFPKFPFLFLVTPLYLFVHMHPGELKRFLKDGKKQPECKN